ncbi:hypothetical protein QJS10_CPA03g00978 [Acorus calamus]|uniref:Saposin B-type domain-containing protein n=1 Tax=Acorus calamus TaxID=4465 RepID=A0AAV9F5R7_ACOCL|nr:hypothetical protein QJS10_CPA03g00978 [Acorus calamus]
MGMRVGSLVFLVLAVGWAYAEARNSLISDESVMQINNQMIETESENSQPFKRTQKLCTLCEQYITQVVHYIGGNQTQTKFTDFLHEACSRLHLFEEQCTILVDYYASLFFMKVSLINPDCFCAKLNLCDDDICDICHQVVSGVLVKLRDPDSQLEVIEILLKACNQSHKHETECKKLVFKYGPLIMDNAERILEATDLCGTLSFCEADGKVPMVESS